MAIIPKRPARKCRALFCWAFFAERFCRALFAGRFLPGELASVGRVLRRVDARRMAHTGQYASFTA
jgi:hypothetical protein